MSKLTEEIKRLSRKIDNIDQRVEKIEENQTQNGRVLSGWSDDTPKPKFKKGDWVRSMVTGTVGQIESGHGFKNHLNDNWNVYVVTIDGNHFTSRENLLEPYFPKEGEYMYISSSMSTYNYIAIFSHTDATYLCVKCFIDTNIGKFYPPYSIRIPLVRINAIGGIRPATAEEKKLLDSKLAEKRLKFDGKNIVKDNTPKVGDFCIFWDNPGFCVCDTLKCIDNDGRFIRDSYGYINCVKFESEEQFRRIKEGKK